MYSVRESLEVQTPMLFTHVYESGGEGVGEFSYLLYERVDFLVKFAVLCKWPVSKLHLIYKRRANAALKDRLFNLRRAWKGA